MNLRLSIYQLSEDHNLGPAETRQLLALSGLEQEPADAARRTWHVVALLAGGLAGLGIVMWIAANWDSLGRMERFALLQGVVLVMGLGALLRPAARAPLGLLTLLGVGALFAYFGQTYQTGADAWQLFALWAALTVPLALGVRHDAVWTLWTVVAAVGIALWVQTHTGHRWQVLPDDLSAHGSGWLALGVLCAALSPAWRHRTGAGAWSFRTAIALTVVEITVNAIGALFHKTVAPHYGFALVLLAGAAFWFSRRAHFEVFGLSLTAIALDTLLVGGAFRLMMDSQTNDPIGHLLLVALIAAGLLGFSVQFILRRVRELSTPEDAP